MYRAPQSAPASYQRLAFLIPVETDWRALVLGALVPPINEWIWQNVGGLSSEDAAQIWRDMLEQWTRCEVANYVGQIVWMAGESADTSIIRADGREVSKDDYSELYTVVGDVWGSASGGFFRVPNLCSRAVIGAGQGSGLSDRTVGETGGQERVTLDNSELPNHRHSVHDHLEALAMAPGELPVTIPSLIPNYTGNEGGGQSHENMPPFAVLIPYIVAR